MKIYLFDVVTGVYQGEDFSDGAPLSPGNEALPPGATIIAPPPYKRGEVPVFVVAEARWEVRSVSDLLVAASGDPAEVASDPAGEPGAEEA